MALHRLHSTLVLVAVLAVPAVARGQEPAATFDQLRFVLAPQSDIRILETNGRTVKATFVGFSGESLDVLVDGSRQLISPEDVVRIGQRKDDSLSNGARNGLIAGAAIGLLGGIEITREAGGSAGVFIPVGMAIYGGIGAGIGVGIDALIKAERTVYDARARRTSLSIAPILWRERKGVAVTLGF